MSNEPTPQPTPQPRRDSFGVPWCSQDCSAYYYSEHHNCRVLVTGLHSFPRPGAVCEPQARADADELRRYRRDHTAATEALIPAQPDSPNMVTATWPTLPELAQRAAVHLAAVQAERDALRREVEAWREVIAGLEAQTRATFSDRPYVEIAILDACNAVRARVAALLGKTEGQK